MSQMLLDNDTQRFQAVVLVEHPTAESYTIAFVTASTPESIEQATDTADMVTLFMPMAPDPVMGGHVVHVPASRVYDVDMTVEDYRHQRRRDRRERRPAVPRWGAVAHRV